MGVTFSGSMVTALASDIVQEAFLEMNFLAAGETLQASDMAWGLNKLQRIIDQWNAMREMIYTVGFTLYTLIPNHSPHTIGPTGDFNTGPAAAYRPVSIVGAAFILNSGAQAIDLPVNLRDDDWWRDNPVKGLTSSVVTDLYYSPDLPNGSLFFYPTCTGSNQVRLEMATPITQALTQQTSLALAIGYWEALVLTLAVSLIPSAGNELDAAGMQVLMARQKEAIRVVMKNNTSPPRITTDSGMPGSQRSGRPDFNFLTGMRE